MTAVFGILLRLAAVVIGYALACLAASAFLHLTFLGSQGPDTQDGLLTGSLFFSVPFVALFVAYLAFLPSALVIAVAEFFSRRDWLTYAIAGGAVGLIVAGIVLPMSLPTAGGLDLPEGGIAGPAIGNPFHLAVLVGGGICGGLAYWLVAGRWTPDWRRRRGDRLSK